MMTLCITPRAATLTLAADPTLDDLFSASWEGPAPRIREDSDLLEVDYPIAARLHALSSRRGSLTLTLNPSADWAIKLRGGVSGLRADLRALEVSDITIGGGASDVVLDLPRPRSELSVRIEGGVSGAVIRRPADVGVAVEIEGGATRLKLDETELGAAGGAVRQWTPSAAGSDPTIAVRVLGGASGLTIGGLTA